MGIKERAIDMVLSGLMHIDFMPFIKTKIGAVVLVAAEYVDKIPLPEGAPLPPMQSIKEVLQWIGTILVLYGLAMWKARSAADKKGIAVPYILDMKRIQKEILGD